MNNALLTLSEDLTTRCKMQNLEFGAFLCRKYGSIYTET